ncbi:MAG: outer membrane lipoprotein carrier protein LolA [Pseudomonadota bacterium]
MLTPALTALALIMTAAHHVPLALQALPDLPIEETDEDAAAINATESEAVATPLPSLPDRVDLTETSTQITENAIDESVEPVSEAPAELVTEVEETTDDVPARTQPTALTGDELTTTLEAISEALSAAQTAKGKFQQVNADGSVSSGSFALRRPGRVRFDYDDPTPILIVSDGATVAMEDRDLETVDRIPLASTPLGLLLDDRLDFDEEVDVINVFRNEERISVTVQDATGEVEGDLTMVFAAGTYDLLGWLTLDANFQTTVVELSDVEQNIRLNPRLFRIDEDEEEER